MAGINGIRNNLLDNSYGLKHHSSTEGLDIIKWKTPIIEKGDKIDVKLNIWDFGGQGKYRFIQQFFCTSNALYIYVTDHKDNIQDVYLGESYWLALARAFGYDDEKGKYSPTIYVSNKNDSMSDGHYINQKELKKNYDNIECFITTSCKNGRGIEILDSKIRIIIKNVGIMGQKFNINWLNVKRILEDYNTEIISKEGTFMPLCQKNGLSEEQARIWLSSLASIGSVLMFPNVLGFEDKIIIDPNWARKVAYKILDSELVIKNGYFMATDAKSIWPDYPCPLELISLVKAFELCYEIDTYNEKKYFVPLLFPVRPPQNIIELRNTIKDKQNKTILLYLSFIPFLPAGIVSRLIVRQFHIMINEHKYCNNVTFSHDGGKSTCEIIEDYMNNSIHLILSGENYLSLFDIIYNDFNLIFQSIIKVKHIDFINYNNQLICDCENHGPCYFDFKEVRRAYENGQFLFDCKKFPQKQINLLKMRSEKNAINVNGPLVIQAHGDTKVKIKKVNVKKGGVGNFADIINQNCTREISENDIALMIEGIEKLLITEKESFENVFTSITDSTDKISIGEAVKDFLIKHGVPVSQSFTGTAIYEIAKNFL